MLEPPGDCPPASAGGPDGGDRSAIILDRISNMTAPGTTPAISRMSVWRIRATHVQTAAPLAVEPGSRMPLGMPRQQHMVIGQWLGDTAGHRDDIQRRRGSDPVAWGDNHRRAQLGNAVCV